MNESYAGIIASMEELERDIARRQKALELLRQALQLMEGTPGLPSAPSKDSLPQMVDHFIDSLQDGDGFTVEDILETATMASMERTEGLRAKLTSILGRRVKNKTIERVGERGSYAKPNKEY